MSSPRAVTRYGARRADLEALISDLGEPAYRARQLHEGLFEQRRPLESLTNIPRTLRDRMADELPLALAVDTMQLADDDTTAKWLWRATDGAQIETVLMRVLRGSGARGLAALYAESDVVRPFLGLRRMALAAHATANAIPWHEDPSNR